jgi:hypothetical protein
VQLLDERVDDHGADDYDKYSKRPQGPLGAWSESGSGYRPGGFGYELTSFQVYDQLIFEALMMAAVFSPSFVVAVPTHSAALFLTHQ